MTVRNKGSPPEASVLQTTAYQTLTAPKRSLFGVIPEQLQQNKPNFITEPSSRFKYLKFIYRRKKLERECNDINKMREILIKVVDQCEHDKAKMYLGGYFKNHLLQLELDLKTKEYKHYDAYKTHIYKSLSDLLIEGWNF